MRLKIKGIKRSTVKGTTYYYAWRGGPRIDAVPGTPVFMKLYNEALLTLKIPTNETVMKLITDYKASSKFTKKSDKTRKDYLRYLKVIEDKFGTMTIEALEDLKVRGEFLKWRDEIAVASGDRTADYSWTVLKLLLNDAVDRGSLTRNPCERGGTLYDGDRSDIIWESEHLNAMWVECSVELQTAILLAIWTGQRQGDLLVVKLSAYDGRVIRLGVQGKARGQKKRKQRKLVIPVGAPLKARLDWLKAQRMAKYAEAGVVPIDEPILLTERGGRPWTEDGFRSSWDKAYERAGIETEHGKLHFHDLRGTAVTRLAIAGCTPPEIATFTGHSLKTVNEILEKYLHRDLAMAENALRKLELVSGGETFGGQALLGYEGSQGSAQASSETPQENEPG